jgi:hypothetical protein
MKGCNLLKQRVLLVFIYIFLFVCTLVKNKPLIESHQKCCLVYSLYISKVSSDSDVSVADAACSPDFGFIEALGMLPGIMVALAINGLNS